MIPEWLLQWFGTILGSLAVLLVTWNRQERKERDKAIELRMSGLEGSIQSIKLAMAGDIPTKEDLAEVSQRLGRLEGTLGQVRDLVIRLEERGNVHVRP
jgi:hypothetical protein